VWQLDASGRIPEVRDFPIPRNRDNLPVATLEATDEEFWFLSTVLRWLKDTKVGDPLDDSEAAGSAAAHKLSPTNSSASMTNLTSQGNS
jgi:hypothetical protein